MAVSALPTAKPSVALLHLSSDPSKAKASDLPKRIHQDTLHLEISRPAGVIGSGSRIRFRTRKLGTALRPGRVPPTSRDADLFPWYQVK